MSSSSFTFTGLLVLLLPLGVVSTVDTPALESRWSVSTAIAFLAIFSATDRVAAKRMATVQEFGGLESKVQSDSDKMETTKCPFSGMCCTCKGGKKSGKGNVVIFTEGLCREACGKKGVARNGLKCATRQQMAWRSCSGPPPAPKPIKVMQWNILASGLAGDGFIAPQWGRSSSNLIVRRGTEWDTIMNTSADDGNKAEQLIAEFNGQSQWKTVTEDGTMSELIRDTMAFKKYVVGPTAKSLKNGIGDPATKLGQACKASEYTYDKKVTFRSVAVCASHWQASHSPVYQGHEAEKLCKPSDDCSVLESFPSASDYKAKYSITAQIFTEGKCKTVNDAGDGLLNVCGEGNPELLAFYVDVLNKYSRALERFNRKWGLRNSIQGLDKLLKWGSAAWQEEKPGFKWQDNDGRGKMLVEKIKKEKPDILMLEELDHYRFFQDALEDLDGVKYTSTMDGSKYEFAKSFLGVDYHNAIPGVMPPTENSKYFKSLGKDKMSDGDAKEEEKKYIQSMMAGEMKKFAFLPKRQSNCQKFHTTPVDISAGEFNDNDGAAVFWNTERFKALRISKAIYPVQLDQKKRVTPGKEGGVTGVLLEDLQVPSKRVWALTTHVPSGDSVKNEAERISMVKNVSDQIQTWIKESVDECQENCQVEMVVGMDGNSHPDFSGKDLAKQVNMHNTILNGWKTDNVQLRSYTLEESDEGIYPSLTKIAASVNKMRGLASAQPWKIGAYQCNRIDYVLMSQGLVEKTKAKFPIYNVNMEDPHVGNADDVAEMYNGILPNMDNPSDHLPFIVKLDYNETKLEAEPTSV